MALPSYGEIVELFKKGLTLEAQEKIMQLREAILELQEENHSLRERNKALADELKQKGELVYEGESYWLQQGNKRDGPFCQKCQDVDSKLVRMVAVTYDGVSHWRCHQCQRSFKR